MARTIAPPSTIAAVALPVATSVAACDEPFEPPISTSSPWSRYQPCSCATKNGVWNPAGRKSRRKLIFSNVAGGGAPPAGAAVACAAALGPADLGALVGAAAG